MKLLNEFYCYPDTTKNPLYLKYEVDINEDSIISFEHGCKLTSKCLILNNDNQDISINFKKNKINISTHLIENNNLHAKSGNRREEYSYNHIPCKIDLYKWFLFLLTHDSISISDLELMLFKDETIR